MHGFSQQQKLHNYLELLAQERAKTERLFILGVMAKEASKNRRRQGRKWVVNPIHPLLQQLVINTLAAPSV